MGNLDRNTLVLWLSSVFLAATGGTIGTQYFDAGNQPHGGTGAALREAVSTLTHRQEVYANKLEKIERNQGIIEYRQNDCSRALDENEAGLRELEKITGRLQKLEWEMDHLKDQLLGPRGKSTANASFLEPGGNPIIQVEVP